MLGALWLLTHRYQGLAKDARIYAVQALSKIHPALATDLYLQNTSQDRYTVFSPFYAHVIRLIGLPDAARVLTVLFAAGFLAAAGNMAKTLVGSDEAWLAVGTLIITVGAYGSYGVFHFSEDYLTARSAAEALIATALAIRARGSTRLALVVACAALLVHPLMALPGVLLLIFLNVPTWVATCLCLSGIALTVAIALVATFVPAARTVVPIMDADWLHIVTERSQFLFLQLWSARDWELNLRPFAALALSALVFEDARIRKLCVAAAMVGASGLIVAMVAGRWGPVALLVQGQAWRWVWITAFISAILLLPTALRLWKDQPCGPLCALLLVAAATMSVGHAPVLAWVALALFLVRARLAPAADYSRAVAVLLGLALVGWELAHALTAVPAATNALVGAPVSTESTSLLLQAGTLAALRFPLAISLLLTWQLVRTAGSRWIPNSCGAVCGVACLLLIPVAFAKNDVMAAASQAVAFDDWRTAIPAAATVYVANGQDAASFAWFTLQRANYLSLDQSAGVVFSRATALEVQRRSRILLPLMAEDWKLLSANRAAHSPGGKGTPRRTPLTAKSLVSLCSDPELGFLIAREDVGFDPVRHRQPGLWKDWNLYDCGHVRSLGPAG